MPCFARTEYNLKKQDPDPETSGQDDSRGGTPIPLSGIKNSALTYIKRVLNFSFIVIPTKVGIQFIYCMDSRFHGVSHSHSDFVALSWRE